MNSLCDPITEDFQLRPHAREYSGLVAGWVAGRRELHSIAPGTPGPLCAEKVDAWTSGSDTPYLFWDRHVRPVAYAELNPMPAGPHELWIGHVIVEPALRGRGIGTRLMDGLISTAFQLPWCRRVSLVVFPDNAHAVQCYLKSGMHTDGVQSHQFRMQGQPCRMLRMTISRRQFERRRPPARLFGAMFRRLTS